MEYKNSKNELARAARKDSSAMKTIAVPTMAFLPATFLSTLSQCYLSIGTSAGIFCLLDHCHPTHLRDIHSLGNSDSSSTGAKMALEHLLAPAKLANG